VSEGGNMKADGGTASEAEPAQQKTFVDKMLDGIERVGNKVPHPAIIFLLLIVFVIVLSAILSLLNVSVTQEIAEYEPIEAQVTYVGGSIEPVADVDPAELFEEGNTEIREETLGIENLLSVDGIRFIFTSFVQNFADFSVVAVILVAMIGVGVAEKAGMMAALIRKLVQIAPRRAITFIIVFVGMLSSVASDAGYLILIPLSGAAFLSLGRHPIAGIAAAYAGVGAGFGVNKLITPTDAIITEITNEAIQLADPDLSINITANFYFAVVATLFITLVITVISERLIEPRLGVYRPEQGADQSESSGGADDEVAPADESRGLRYALYGLLGTAVVIGLLTALPGAPLRNPETGAIIGDSPFMDSLIFIITLVFLIAGLCFGIGARSLKSSNDVIDAITGTFATLAALLFLLLLISQFIALFNYTNMPQVAAIAAGDLLESASIGVLPLLIGFILVIAVIDIIIPGVAPKWAIFAPIFIPLFLQLGVAPQTVTAAYRVGDGPMNVITPLMVYLPFIVVVAQRYRKDAGVGTIVSLMLPYTVIVLVAWTLFFALWFVLGIPLGPGFGVGI
jgi:aminobenzoyl-glutamate transport protein